MKFAQLSMIVAAAGLAFAAPAFAADAPAKYTAENIKTICATKKNPKACESRRKVGEAVTKRDMAAMNKKK